VSLKDAFGISLYENVSVSMSLAHWLHLFIYLLLHSYNQYWIIIISLMKMMIIISHI